ncbi:solute carrier family 25 member 34 isoform X4 [Temnothorax longispinosus]|uniref:solute carrier family 25 member 34 isoform X4 n=1 Tax=Temnothorax longispinosus TaxID=300112 RepID=UPI003A99AB0D
MNLQTDKWSFTRWSFTFSLIKYLTKKFMKSDSLSGTPYIARLCSITSGNASDMVNQKEFVVQPGVEFAIGALAAVGAGFFTNPMDVVKVRLQLQGELEARGSYTKIYKNTLHAAYLIAKHEGVLALQAGLVPALAFQVVLNGIRLGVYKSAQRYELIVDKRGNTDVLRTTLVSGTAGCLGAVLGSPLYLVKTQLQAQSAKSIAVGYQHNHSGSWDAFRFLWMEGGVTALYRGWNANMPRVFVGSATQLTTFGLASDWLRSLNIARYC